MLENPKIYRRSIDVYTVFAPNSFPMKINPIIRRNVFKINVNTETCIPNNFDNTRARPETLPATIFQES